MKDKELINLIEHSAEMGIKKAIDLYGGTVKAVAGNILRGYDECVKEEVWGETFYRLWKYASKYDERKGASLKTYIATITRNVALETMRKTLEKSMREVVGDDFE